MTAQFLKGTIPASLIEMPRWLRCLLIQKQK